MKANLRKPVTKRRLIEFLEQLPVEDDREIAVSIDEGDIMDVTEVGFFGPDPSGKKFNIDFKV